MAAWTIPPSLGKIFCTKPFTKSKFPMSPLASVTRHPYDIQSRTILAEASSLMPLRLLTTMCRAPCCAMCTANVLQRPFRPPTMRYETSGDSLSVRIAGRVGTMISVSFLFVITILPI
jgi:hypothetical protein